MPVNATHADYDAALANWIRVRDLLAGEDAVKAAGEKYLPRLEGQSDEDYDAYKMRATFFNTTRRAADAFVGLLFRKSPFIRILEGNGAHGVTRPTGIAGAMAGFVNDVDILGTSLLISGEKDVVRERVSPDDFGAEGDEFASGVVEQLRVLKLQAAPVATRDGTSETGGTGGTSGTSGTRASAIPDITARALFRLHDLSLRPGGFCEGVGDAGVEPFVKASGLRGSTMKKVSSGKPLETCLRRVDSACDRSGGAGERALPRVAGRGVQNQAGFVRIGIAHGALACRDQTDKSKL